MSTATSDSVIEPVVGVVLPTYNRAPLLGRALRSVLGQSFDDFEVLVIDDGSTDETAGIVAAFGDPRIRYVQLARNTGAGAARNVGIRMSRGKFPAFQDSDDEWVPSKLARQMSAFGEETAVIRALLAAGGTGWWVPDASVEHWIIRRRQTIGYLRDYYALQGKTFGKWGRHGGPMLLGRPLWLWGRILWTELAYARARLGGDPHRWLKPLVEASFLRGSARR